MLEERMPILRLQPRKTVLPEGPKVSSYYYESCSPAIGLKSYGTRPATPLRWEDTRWLQLWWWLMVIRQAPKDFTKKDWCRKSRVLDPTVSWSPQVRPSKFCFFPSRWSLPTFESCQPSSCGLRGCLKKECLYSVCSQEKLFCPKVRRFHHIIMSHAVLQSVWRVMRRDQQSYCVGKTRTDCSCDGGWWSGF